VTSPVPIYPSCARGSELAPLAVVYRPWQGVP